MTPTAVTPAGTAAAAVRVLRAVVREVWWWATTAADLVRRHPARWTVWAGVVVVAVVQGYWLALAVVAGPVLGLALWCRVGGVSYARWVGMPAWRRRTRRQVRALWPDAMRAVGLTHRTPAQPSGHPAVLVGPVTVPVDRIVVPALVSLRWRGGLLVATPRLLLGQTVADWDAAGERLRVKVSTDEHGVFKYPIVKMCEWLEVSTSGFYEWVSRPMSATAQRREYLKLLIVRACHDSDGTYGYRRLHAQLGRWGEACSAELARALSRQLGLVACQPRPWRHSLTESGPSGPIPDLVRRDFSADTPGTKMVGDITYIPTWQGWLFLATVIDCCTKAVIGWAMDNNYQTPLISAAIDMAARNHNLASKAIFHSDRGSNYQCRLVRPLLAG